MALGVQTPQRAKPGPVAAEFLQTFKELKPILHELFHKTLTSSFHETGITLIPSSDKDFANTKPQTSFVCGYAHKFLGKVLESNPATY